jgi:hypothetical protein
MIHTLHKLSAAGTDFRDRHAVDVQREFIRVTGGSGRIVNVSAVARGPTMEPWHATGIKVLAGKDWWIKNARMQGFDTIPKPGGYRQGDGFATELGCDDITFENARALDCGDGGFDLKGKNWKLKHTGAERCGKNYRLWSGGRATTMTSRDPRICHVHICISVHHKTQQTIRIDRLVATGDPSKPVILVDTIQGAIPPKIILGEVQAPEGAKLLRVDGPQPEIIRL